jgi:hypothetical protein
MGRPDPNKLSTEDEWKCHRYIARSIKDRDNPTIKELIHCKNYGDIICALTGDSTFVLPSVRAIREEMVKRLPEIMRRAEVKTRDKKTGQTEIEL